MLILFTFYNCQKEDLTTTQNQEVVTKALYKQRTITLKDIPKIEQKVIEKLNPEVFNRTEGSNTNQAIFDTENVLEIIDTLNNANYSFQFRFPDTPLSTFYNLIVGETPTGDVLTPYVMKYTCDDANLDAYIANGLDFKYFVGTMSIHKYTDYFALGEFDRTETDCPPELDEVGDPISCAETPVGGGGGDLVSGSGSGPGNTGGTGSTGGGSNGSVICAFEVYVTDCGASNEDSMHLIGICGGNTSTATIHHIWNCDDNQNPTAPAPDGEIGRTVNDDCPSCETATPIGGIGVVTPKDEFLADLIEDSIITINLDPCTENILNDLKNLTSDISNVLNRFGNVSSTYDWEIESGTPTDPSHAFETNWDIDTNGNVIPYQYVTIVNPTFVNQATNLSIARVVLHEAIHSYILSYVDDTIENSTNTSLIDNFSEVWNYYVAQQNGVAVGNIEDAHHEQMAATFVETIGAALAEYDNNQQDINYYYYLAWGALFETNAWNTVTSFFDGEEDPYSVVDAIIAANIQEDTNGLDAVGLPCL